MVVTDVKENFALFHKISYSLIDEGGQWWWQRASMEDGCKDKDGERWGRVVQELMQEDGNLSEF